MTELETGQRLIQATGWWDAGRPARLAHVWVHTWRKGIGRIKTRQWELVARQGAEAKRYSGYIADLKQFLVDGSDSQQSAGKRWDNAALAADLLRCIEDAARPRDTETDNGFALLLEDFPEDVRNELDATNRMELARSFVICVVRRIKAIQSLRTQRETPPEELG